MGFISSFILNSYRKVCEFLKNSYNFSKLKVVNDKAVSSTILASGNSVICKALSSEAKTTKYYENSFICKAVNIFSNFFKTIGKYLTPLANKSVIIRFFSFFASNIMNFPLKVFGAFLLSFGITGVVHMFFETLQPASVIIIAGSIVVGLFFSLIKASLCSILCSSKVFGIILSFFSKKEYNPDCFNSKILSIGKTAYFSVCAFGVFLGGLSVFISPFYALGAVVAITGVVLILYNFKLGAYLSILFFPFLPTMVIVGILLLSIISLVLKAIFNNEFKLTKTGLDVYMVLFAFIISISGITSFDRATSVNVALVYIVFIFSYFVFTNTITDRKKLFVSLAMLVFSGLIVSLYGIYQYVFGFSGGNVWIDTGMFSEIETRVVSTFENPNVLGEYLLIIIPIAIGYFFESDSIKEKFASFFALGILILCMVFTFSRGCWIGLIISFGVMSLFYDRRFVWLGFLLILLSPFYLPESIIQRFLSVGDTSDTSTSYRVYIWFGTIDMLKDYWLTGIGLGEGAFNVIYPHYSYSAIVAPHSHNLYLQIMVENGITGAICFAVMVITFYKNSISALVRVKRGFLKVSLLALTAAVTGYLVQGLFDNVWYNYRVVMFFFMTFAITMQCAKIAVCDNSKGRGNNN